MLDLHPAVPAALQQRTLAAIVERVAEEVGRSGAAAVQIDLDLSALVPGERTEAALLQLAHEHWAPALLRPRALPGYTPEAWGDWLEVTELGVQLPALRRRRSLDCAAFWQGAPLESDRPTPGLAAFCERVTDEGGTVVFRSCRRGDAETATRAALGAAGLAHLPLVLYDRCARDAEGEAWRQAELRARFGPLVAIIDDEQHNREAVAKAAGPGVLKVAVALPGFSAAPATREAPLRISTFEGCHSHQEEFACHVSF